MNKKREPNKVFDWYGNLIDKIIVKLAVWSEEIYYLISPFILALIFIWTAISNYDYLFYTLFSGKGILPQISILLIGISFLFVIIICLITVINRISRSEK